MVTKLHVKKRSSFIKFINDGILQPGKSFDFLAELYQLNVDGDTNLNGQFQQCQVVLVFERRGERAKKFDGPHIKLVSQQNELDPGWFSALITCANEATLTYQFNYINVL